MNRNSYHPQLQQVEEFSLNTTKELIDKNNEELHKIKNLIETHLKKDYKYPLLACVFLLFYDSGKTTLKKSELYSLMEKELIKYKGRIISSPTERYKIITKKNYKTIIKDIIKKKKWFIRKVNDSKEIEYSLIPNCVCSITKKIISYLKVLEKNNLFFTIDTNTCDNEKENDIKENDESQDFIVIMDSPKEEKTNDNNQNHKEEISINKIKINIKEKKKVKKEKSENKVKRKKNLKKEKENQDKNKIREDYDIIIDDDDCEQNENYLNESMINLPEKNNHLFNDIKLETVKNNTVELGDHFLKIKRKKSKAKFRKKNSKRKKNKIKGKLDSSFISLDIEENSSLQEGIEKDLKSNGKSKPLEKYDNTDISTNSSNKLDTIIKIGEQFLTSLKNYNFHELSAIKINSLKEEISRKEKEIESDKKLIEKITKLLGNVKTINKKKAEERIYRITKNYDEFQEKIKLLSNYKRKIENDSKENKDISEIKKTYNEDFEKCSKIYENLLLDFPLFYKDCSNLMGMVRVTFPNQMKDNSFSNIQSFINFDDYRNSFKNLLNNVIINDDTTLKKNDLIDKCNKPIDISETKNKNVQNGSDEDFILIKENIINDNN